MQLTPFPSDLGLPDFYDERYMPLWNAIEETDLTIMNHLDLKTELWDVFRRDPTPQKGIFTGLPWAPLAETICIWILTGTLEKYPEAAGDLRRAGPGLAAVVLRVRCSIRACTSTTSSPA